MYTNDAHLDALNELVNSHAEFQPVSFANWEKIDCVERKRGKKLGKPREKIVSTEEMLRIINE